jgi:hypothetical protein
MIGLKPIESTWLRSASLRGTKLHADGLSQRLWGLSECTLLDFSVGEGFQFFYDLLQPAATLGMILLRWQGASLLGILLVESLDVTDLCLQQLDPIKNGFSSI